MPESSRRALSKIRATFPSGDEMHPRLRWTKPENLHLTVRFLGDIDESVGDLMSLKLRGALAKFGPLTIRIEGINWFPRSRPSVLAASVVSSQRLLDLYETVEAKVVSLGLAPERREPAPHITIARLPRPTDRGLQAINEKIEMSFESTELVLFSSRLLPTGAKYVHFDEISFCSGH